MARQGPAHDAASVYFHPSTTKSDIVVSWLLQLNTFQSLEDAAKSLTTWVAAGSTNMAAALRMANDVMFTPVNGDRADVPNYVVLITDGRSDNRTETVAEAVRLRVTGAVIVVVGIGDSVDAAELALIASSPSSSTVLRSTPRPGASIDSTVLDAVVNIICRNEMACQSAPCLNGGTCVDRVAGTYSCRCPNGFTGIRCERGCSSVIDLVFALDVSGSTRRERFVLLPFNHRRQMAVSGDLA